MMKIVTAHPSIALTYLYPSPQLHNSLINLPFPIHPASSLTLMKGRPLTAVRSLIRMGRPEVSRQVMESESKGQTTGCG